MDSLTFKPHLDDTLARLGGVFYNVTGAPNAAAANRCMEKVRAYRV